MRYHLRIDAAAVSDRGKVRNSNEDNIYFNGEYLEAEKKPASHTATGVFRTPCVFAVCDGMGGMEDGEIASYSAVSSLASCELFVKEDCSKDKVLDAVKKANDAVCGSDSTAASGSTLALITLSGTKLIAANVGDSRIYRLRGGTIEQLSVDHNQAKALLESGLISEETASSHPQRNYLTQYLGINPEEMTIEPTVKEDDVINNDVYLICSDGLSSMVLADEMSRILSQDISAEMMAQELVETALSAGGSDNISVIVLKACYVSSKRRIMPTRKELKEYLSSVAVLSAVMVLLTMLMRKILLA